MSDTAEQPIVEADLPPPQQDLRQQNTALRKEVKELERAMKALVEENGFKSLLLDKALDSIHLHDLAGTPVYVNETACLVKGYSRQELLSLPLQKMVSPEFAALVEPRIKNIQEQGEAVFESEHLTKDGERIPVEVHSSAVRYRGQQLILSIVHDLRQRRAKEESVKESEEQYRRLFESLQDVFYRTDMDGILTVVSPSVVTLFGYIPDEVIGQDLAQMFYWDPQDRPAFLKLIGARGYVENHRTKCRNKDGDAVWVSTNARFYQDENGEVCGVEGITRDITAQIWAEEKLERTMAELRRSNVDLEQFAYVASHDLQEPLRMVSSFTQLLQKRYERELDTDADEFIHFITEGAQRMQQLINDLLVYSRVDRSGRTFADASCEAILQQTLDNLQLLIGKSGCQITHDSLPNIYCDASQILVLFQNLLSNAIKYCGEDPPRIHIACHHCFNAHRISVKDNGIGIAPEYCERIFKIFQRLHPRDEYSGTGIGLSLCKKIVERHGGIIWVESEEGKGATFHFSIPDRLV